MSGTFLSNTVADAVGQARGVNPYIFGDDVDNFADIYGISAGLIKDDTTAKTIKDRLRATTTFHEAIREDWSYMLPIKQDEIRFAQLTELQHEFYNILMQEAMLMLIESEKKKGRTVSVSDNEDEGNGGDDDDEEDEDDEDLSAEEKEENAFMAKAKTHLQKVEAFLVAPDENEQYVNWERHPSGDDLISPKVRLADQLIEAHLNKYKGNLAHNKIMVFGWNVAASRHFMKHSKYANIALHYTAGDQEVIRKYENDPTAVLLVGNEASMREGLNLQMTSLILRMQSVWTPGEHEQFVARMYRPDPRGKYNRDEVEHLWLLTSLPGDTHASLDQVKMARLISKTVSLARFTYEGRLEWRQVSKEFDDLQMLKMNLGLIFDSRAEDMDPYFGSWKTFVRWENGINTTAKRRVAEKLEAEHNVDLIKDGKIIDINLFIKLAMSEVTSSRNIKGSKKVWVPFIGNAIPADPNGWGFSVLGQQNVAPGTVVYTEFGPAVIEKLHGKSAKVRIYDGRVLGLMKSTILLVNSKRYKEFAAIVKDPTKWRANAIDIVPPKLAKPVKGKTQVEDDVDLEAKPTKGKPTEKLELDPIGAVLNGWPAMLVMEDVPELRNVDKWNRVDPFISVRFRNWAAAAKFLDLLPQKVYISDKTMDALHEEMKQLQEGHAMVLGKQINMANFRNFFRTQHRKLGTNGKKIVVKPYWIATDREIMLAFDTQSHDSRFISWLKRQQSWNGIKKIRSNDAIWAAIFSNVREAYNDIENLMKIANVDKAQLREDLLNVRDTLSALKKPRRNPSL